MHDSENVLENDFQFNGRAASWAPTETGPRFWGAEDEHIDLPAGDLPADHSVRSLGALALTSDGRFLAVAVCKRVWLYKVTNLDLCAELAPHPHDVLRLESRPWMPDGGADADAEYLLVSETATRYGEGSPKVYLSRLKGTCGSIALDAPTPQLLAEGTLPAHGSGIWSPDGKRMLYLTHTEAGAPEVVVLDAISLRETCRLSGHNDAILSASWSPDGTLIATASRDGSYGIWVALSGVRRHSIATCAPNYSCCFLSDGAHLLVSGGPTDRVNNRANRIAIYSVDAAELIVSLRPPKGINLKPLARVLAVHPNRDLIIVPTYRHLLAWTPFEMAGASEGMIEESSVQVLLALGTSESQEWLGFTVVSWVDEGRKLLVQGEDETIFVWDLQQRQKWQFRRTCIEGRAVGESHRADVLYVRRHGADWVFSMGEGRIRFWRL